MEQNGSQALLYCNRSFIEVITGYLQGDSGNKDYCDEQCCADVGAVGCADVGAVGSVDHIFYEFWSVAEISMALCSSAPSQTGHISKTPEPCAGAATDRRTWGLTTIL